MLQNTDRQCRKGIKNMQTHRTKTLGGENFHPMQDINFEFA